MDFKGPPDATGIVAFGYGLAAPYRRQGYGTEAVGRIARWAFRHPSVRAITADVARSNVASQRLLGRLGFTLAAEVPGGMAKYGVGEDALVWRRARG